MTLYGKSLCDMNKVPLEIGQKVARAMTCGSSPYIDICTVTRIENGKVYLDNSKQALNYPGRLLILQGVPNGQEDTKEA